ncbi:deaminase domain-containing protein [Burkholderia anthina]|uniref:deaminase domain-containing protein n=1 Tax=Burkholderia anthina TaxID=179879 RepID=UPI00158931AC
MIKRELKARRIRKLRQRYSPRPSFGAQHISLSPFRRTEPLWMSLRSRENRERALDILLELLPRRFEVYFRANRKIPKKSGNHSANFKGNIGGIYFDAKPHFDGGSWIGGSFKADSLTRWPIHYGNSLRAYVGSLPESKKLYFGTQLGASLIFGERLRCFCGSGGPNRYDDSEYLLLNALSYAIDKFGTKSGAAYLITERVPCQSCTYVINQFLWRYPKIRLNLFYMYDSGRRSHREFLSECAFSERMSAHFVQITPDIQNPGKAVGHYVKVDASIKTMSFTAHREGLLASGYPVHMMLRRRRWGRE